MWMFVKKKKPDITDSTCAETFAITDTKLVPAVTLPSLDNKKLLEQLKLEFNINCDKYNSNKEMKDRKMIKPHKDAGLLITGVT